MVQSRVRYRLVPTRMPSDRSDSEKPAPAPPAGGTVARRHIRLTSHSGGFGALPIAWGAPSAVERGPIVATTTTRAHRNVIGTHSGSYSVYRALAVASGALKAAHKAQLDVMTSDPRLAESPLAADAPPFGRSIVYLQLEGGDVEQDDAVTRLFERYRRLTPGRLYTVTGSRVKVRQLPGGK